MFISDIHGSYYWANKAIEKYHEEKADKLIILGDILYHGPRNDLPKDYNCKKVIALLNPLKKDIIAVRGNCDSEVDQMVLDFPMRSDYALMDVDQHHFFMTHGHLFNEDQLPLLNENDVLIYGHFHKPLAKKENGIYILNPSSISLPKEGTNSYGIYENDCFTIKTFDNEIVKQIKKLKEKKYRDEAGVYVIEGIKMLEEAINENASIEKIVICEDCSDSGIIPQKLMYTIAKYDCIYVSKKEPHGIDADRLQYCGV